MKKIFLINALLEMAAGIVLSLRPDLLLQHAAPELQGVVIARLYAILAFSFGLTSYVLFRNYKPSQMFRYLALIIMVFHLVVSFHMYGAFVSGVTPSNGAFILHLSIALLSLFFYLNDKLPDNTENDITTA